MLKEYRYKDFESHSKFWLKQVRYLWLMSGNMGPSESISIVESAKKTIGSHPLKLEDLPPTATLDLSPGVDHVIEHSINNAKIED